tara:strand:+ start:353 stop:499 length:147 start_codon:yes stop_codon:yes gene_type:complete
MKDIRFKGMQNPKELWINIVKREQRRKRKEPKNNNPYYRQFELQKEQK